MKNGDGDWGLGIGDWGLGIGDWAQSPSPIPNPQSPLLIINYILILFINFNNFNYLIYLNQYIFIIINN